jgi:PAS domain S-box-containing protein
MTADNINSESMNTYRKKPSRMFETHVDLLIIISTSVFVSGVLVNVFISMLPAFPAYVTALLNAASLVLVLFPVIYFLFYRPFRSYAEELHRSGEALQMSEERYRSLVEGTDDSIYVVNRKCEYVFMNAKHRSRLGFHGDEYVGKGYGEFHSEGETKIFCEEVDRVYETGKSLRHEHRSKRDGRYFLRTLSPIRGRRRQVLGVSIVSKNITHLKQ